jgi:hypothetical protein
VLLDDYRLLLGELIAMALLAWSNSDTAPVEYSCLRDSMHTTAQHNTGETGPHLMQLQTARAIPSAAH